MPSPPTPRPGPGTERLLAADAARGLALLGAATATALLWVHGRQLGAGYRPLGAGRLDAVADGLTALLVDNRVLPLLAVALGAGLVVRVRRRGHVDVTRRAGVLLALGAAHAVLVSEADPLGVLALVLLAGLPLATARRRWAVLVCVGAVVPLLLQGAADGLGGTAGFPDPPASYPLSALDRTGTWLLGLVLAPLFQGGLLVALVAGVWLVRSGWLLAPHEHRRGLAALAVTGTLVGLLGAVPYARLVAGAGAADPGRATAAGALDAVTGPAGAVGVVAALALVAARGVGPAWLRALARLGRHSLVVYLATSVVLAGLLAPWAGGLGDRWGTAALTALGATAWAAALGVVGLLAVARDRRARRGEEPGEDPQPTERQGRARSSAT
ncbi:DUF418 domain-containing protein [Aquipuribacter nitratireducens]|uniref:DUF418 domain-containing protein n=1 Tax=Aquipuribacter nitratireducens TaxID=650104 RepID=A0ABW0GJX5_9MICO